MEKDELLIRLREGFALDWHGPHGVAHWRRVRDIGLRLAEETGADSGVVELFAYLHDAERQSEREDPGHGERAEELVDELQGRFFELEPERLELLKRACGQHEPGSHRQWDITLRTCWDADQLDAGRFGKRMNTMKLLTDAACSEEMQRWAWRRARRWASQLRPRTIAG